MAENVARVGEMKYGVLSQQLTNLTHKNLVL